MSRNMREGWFVGRFQGRAIRRRAVMQAIYVGGIELFPESRPYVDSTVAWFEVSRRRGAPQPVRT